MRRARKARKIARRNGSVASGGAMKHPSAAKTTTSVALALSGAS